MLYITYHTNVHIFIILMPSKPQTLHCITDPCTDFHTFHSPSVNTTGGVKYITLQMSTPLITVENSNPKTTGGNHFSFSYLTTIAHILTNCSTILRHAEGKRFCLGVSRQATSSKNPQGWTARTKLHQFVLPAVIASIKILTSAVGKKLEANQIRQV